MRQALEEKILAIVKRSFSAAVNSLSSVHVKQNLFHLPFGFPDVLFLVTSINATGTLINLKLRCDHHLVMAQSSTCLLQILRATSWFPRG